MPPSHSMTYTERERDGEKEKSEWKPVICSKNINILFRYSSLKFIIPVQITHQPLNNKLTFYDVGEHKVQNAADKWTHKHLRLTFNVYLYDFILVNSEFHLIAFCFNCQIWTKYFNSPTATMHFVCYQSRRKYSYFNENKWETDDKLIEFSLNQLRSVIDYFLYIILVEKK